MKYSAFTLILLMTFSNTVYSNSSYLNITCSVRFDPVCGKAATFSYCDPGTRSCKCISNYLAINNDCIATPGAFCSPPGAECVGLAHSRCSLQYKCECEQPYVDNGTECQQLQSLKLTVDSQQETSLNNLDELMKMVENQISDQSTPSEVQHRPISGQQCFTNVDCQRVKNNSNCVNGRCECQLEFIALGNKCYPGIGKQCSVENPCFVKYSKCDDNSLCACEYGYRALNGQCVPGVGNECARPSDKACFNVDNSYCNEKSICSCRSGYKEDKGYCTKLVQTESRRTDVTNEASFVKCKPEQCFAMRGYCNESGYCNCLPGNVETTFGFCTPITMNGVSCNLNLDCMKFDRNSFCSSSRLCICNNNFIMVFNRCYPDLSATCSEELPCGAPNSYCSQERICKCKENFVETFGFCSPK